MKGVVKHFNTERHFGFAIGDDGIDYFFPEREIIGQGVPERGQRISFTPSHDASGRTLAVRVAVIPDEEPPFRGAVKNWKRGDNFGFIRRDDGQPDIFVHRTALPVGVDALQPGDRVAFDVIRTPDGRVRAVRVRPIK